MNSRALSALLSSLISQLLLLLLLLFPSPNPLPPADSIFSFNSAPHDILFPFLLHFISTSEIAATISLLRVPRKRKRAHLQDSDDTADAPDQGVEFVKLGRVDSFLTRDPESFKQFFKMKTSSFEWLCGLLEPLLECRDPVDAPLNLAAESRLGIGLFRLATGADYQEISSRFRVSQSVAKFCVKQLCRVLCTNFRFWVGFPSPNELDSVAAQFETIAGLPNCCGVITCHRFMIARTEPNGSVCKEKSQEESIAAQVVVDSSSKILSIVAGFRGEKCDFEVLKSSTLYKDIEKGVLLNSQPAYINGVAVPQYLVGDGEYSLLPWLLMPFIDPKSGLCEENFNNAHHLMRIPALKAISSLRKWGVLSKPVEVDFRSAVSYIGACSILHNMLLMREDYSAFCDHSADGPSYHQKSQCHRDDAEMKEDLTGKRAADIRSSLALRAEEFHRSEHAKAPSKSS